jgi:putative transposase
MKKSRYTDEQIAFALKQLEDENRQLKQLVADLSLDKHILQDVLSKKL